MECQTVTSFSYSAYIAMFPFWKDVAQILKNHQKMKKKRQWVHFPLFGKDKYKMAKWSIAQSCLYVYVCVLVA